MDPNHHPTTTICLKVVENSNPLDAQALEPNKNRLKAKYPQKEDLKYAAISSQKLNTNLFFWIFDHSVQN